jgi:hypothetical protein
MAIITLRVSAGIQGTRAAFQWLRHFKNLFCSRLHYGNKIFKMTAVEWLIKQIFNEEDESFFEFYNGEIKRANELFEQQIKDAYNDGQAIPPFDYAEKYYNETYKKPLK